jgi:nucleoside-diphosphate-sugar epimerase
VRIFLTGATGFVGGAIASQLVSAGHDVHAVVRTPAKAEALRLLGVHLHSGDVTDKASMHAPMRGADAVMHVAGWYKVGVRDHRDAHAVNVTGTRHVLELMEELGVPRGVYTSTLAVNSNTGGRIVDEDYRFTGRHLSVYDRTKAEAHRIAEDFIARKLPLIIVQPGLVYGPGDTSGIRTMWRDFLARKLPAIPKRTAFAWGYIDDIARAHILALERGRAGRNYFICGPVHTLEEALDMASEITGIPAPKVRIPPVVLRGLSVAMAPISGLVPLPSAFTSEGLRVIAGVTYIGTNARAKRELGWEPRSLRVGLEQTLKHELASH